MILYDVNLQGIIIKNYNIHKNLMFNQTHHYNIRYWSLDKRCGFFKNNFSVQFSLKYIIDHFQATEHFKT